MIQEKSTKTRGTPMPLLHTRPCITAAAAQAASWCRHVLRRPGIRTMPKVLGHLGEPRLTPEFAAPVSIHTVRHTVDTTNHILHPEMALSLRSASSRVAGGEHQPIDVILMRISIFARLPAQSAGPLLAGTSCPFVLRESRFAIFCPNLMLTLAPRLLAAARASMPA